MSVDELPYGGTTRDLRMQIMAEAGRAESAFRAAYNRSGPWSDADAQQNDRARPTDRGRRLSEGRHPVSADACRNCRRPIHWSPLTGWLHGELPQYAGEPITCEKAHPVCEYRTCDHLAAGPDPLCGCRCHRRPAPSSSVGAQSE